MSMDITKPIRKPDVLVQDSVGETLLCSAEQKAVHILNPTARCIWELCDGEHTVEDMVHTVRTSFSVADTRDVDGDIRQTLEMFASKRLLQPNKKLMVDGGTSSLL